MTKLRNFSNISRDSECNCAAISQSRGKTSGTPGAYSAIGDQGDLNFTWILQVPKTYLIFSVDDNRSERLHASFVLERLCNVLDHVLGLPCPRLNTRKVIPFLNPCPLKVYGTIKTVTPSLELRPDRLTIHKSNKHFGNFAILQSIPQCLLVATIE